MVCLESELSSESSPDWLWGTAVLGSTTTDGRVRTRFNYKEKNDGGSQGLLLSPMNTVDDLDRFCSVS